MVELVREKCNVSFEEARTALEACDYDVLEAIVKLEREGKTATEIVLVEQAPQTEATDSQKATEKSEGKGKMGKIWDSLKKGARASMDMSFVAERNGEVLFAIPLLFVLIGLFVWGATLWFMIIGLFFGLRYRIEGAGQIVSSANAAMDKAADVATDVKESISKA